MDRPPLRLQQTLIALVVLAILVVLTVVSRGYVEDILYRPQVYFPDTTQSEEALLLIFTTGALAISILFSAVLYLLLASHTRTELKARRMTKNLAFSGEQFRRLYENAPIPYVNVSSHGQIHNPNKAALRLYGMTAEELTGKNLFSMHPEEDLPEAQQMLEKLRRNIPLNNEEIRIVRKNGGVRWVALSVFDMQFPGQRGRNGIASLVDITEQKMLDQAKTEFVSLASHQLRAPLSTVKWYTEALVGGTLGPLNEKQEQYVLRLQSGNETMIELVNTLLNISRIEMGTLQVDNKMFDLTEVTDSVLDELAPQISEGKLRIKREYDSSASRVDSDPRLVRIVLQNLLTNAVKYTPPEGTITIVLRRDVSGVHIVVSDTGYGIPPEQQERIFTKMFRADNIRKLNVEGTGLGLYLVQRVVQSLNGTIEFKSELNKGTTFTVIFSN